MNRSRRWLLGFVIGTCLAWPGAASACGTLQDWIGRYGAAAADDAGREGALMELAAYCGDYLGATSDRALLSVLGDALTRGREQALVQLVFDRFRCLSAMPDSEDRRALMTKLDVTRCPSAEQRVRWRSVAGDGVNLRSGPSRNAERLATLPRDTVVETSGNQGDWMKAKTLFGVEGFVHASLLVPLPSE